MLKLKGKLSRGVIDHIFSWASVVKHNTLWTKHDENVFKLLENLRKQINQESYKKGKSKIC